MAPAIDGPYQSVTWRPPTGAPSALALTDLHPAVQKAAAKRRLAGVDR